LQWLFEKGLCEEEVISLVKVDPTLSAEVRQKALAMAETNGRRLLECKAARLVRSLYGQALLRGEVLERLAQATGISDRVRALAVELAKRYPEQADALADASWRAVRQPGTSGAPLDRALRQAETAYHIAPRSGTIPTTLGVGYYRAGKYREALRVLREADSLDVTTGSNTFPPTLAIEALALLKLGKPEEAEATFSRLQKLMAEPTWRGNPEALALFREAQAAFKASSVQRR
jgi:tetratricopeptide (TPR) repeat protein